jgi:serine protease Do
VVGINTAIVGPGGNIGIGFAIPINIGKFIYDRLIKGEPITRGLLGVYIRDLNPDLAESLGLKETKGVLVIEVSEDSAADKAGIKRYDVIVQIDDEKVEKANELRSRVAMLKPGTKVELVVLRDGRRKTFKVEIGGSSALAKDTKAVTETVEKLGLAVRNLTDDLAERYGYEDRTGVIIERVEPGSPAAMKGISPGMLIMEVNRRPVKNTNDFNDAIEKASEEGKVLLLIDDGRYRQLVVLKLPKE